MWPASMSRSNSGRKPRVKLLRCSVQLYKIEYPKIALSHYYHISKLNNPIPKIRCLILDTNEIFDGEKYTHVKKLIFNKIPIITKKI